ESRRAARRLAAREATQARQLARSLQEQASELRRRTEEATALATELTRSNQGLRDSVGAAEAARKAAEASAGQLVESEARFRTMADTAPVLIWMSDAQGERTYFNRPWLEFTGREVEQVLGKGWTGDIHPDDVYLYDGRYRSAVYKRDSFTVEYRLHRQDGEYRWILETGIPRVTPEGDFEGFIGSCVDITPLKESENTQQFLLEAARVLASSLDFEATLHQVTTTLVPQFADYCLVHMPGEDGSLRQVAAAHADPDKMRLLEELGRVYHPEPDDPNSMVARAWNVGTLVLTQDAEEVPSMLQNAELQRISLELETRSCAVLPLVARGATLGTILVATSLSGRRYSEGDVALRELLELFAGRAALALDNARLYTQVRLAHERDLRTSQLESQLMQARLEALRAQLNPHFLFNALNTIAMLVRRQANTHALQGIVGLSQLLRQVLDRRGEPEVTLGEELALVQHYLSVEQLRFQDRLGVSVSVPPEVLDARVPSLILQPLVENAVRHGVSRRGETGRIAISGRRHHGTLRLEVRDNGPGFPDGWDPTTSAGIGLANTRERLQRLYGPTHRFKARNGPQGGAVVSVTIPFRPVSPM
ncbi:MAG TPA: histidine kinase, partial [Gemmatimonadales bacterium]|nr:histidine kinase [Gemmatimonadales bacterium]